MTAFSHGPVPAASDTVVLHERLSDAGAGEVWVGVRSADGHRCAVRRLRLPAGPLIREHVRRAGRLLLAVAHPHLVPVLDVVVTGEGAAVVSELPDPSTTLERLAAARELLPGEVVTVGLPIAQALAVLHGAGLTHGRLTARDVLIEPSGRPVLAGYGVAGLLGSAGSAAEDVRDLAAMLLAALGPAGAAHVATGAAPATLPPAAAEMAAVCSALTPALAPATEDRPDASQLAQALGAAVPALPLRLADSVLPRPGPAPRPTSGRRWPRRSALAAVPAAAVLAVLGWLLADLGGSHPAVPTAARVAAPRSGARSDPAVVQWRAVLAGLDRSRSRAFTRLSAHDLAGADAAGSTAYQADLATLRSLAARGARASGLAPELVAVEVRATGSRLTTLRTTDRLPPYSFVDGSGRVLGRSPGAPAHRHDVTLVRARQGWRIALVSEVADR